ncbi:MAG TPA: hypothetical protein VNX25_10685, partial [Verrucomicrobiae bacterium]|nr:hypothetical protein [Verrucomicrobiae bacterium]
MKKAAAALWMLFTLGLCTAGMVSAQTEEYPVDQTAGPADSGLAVDIYGGVASFRWSDPGTTPDLSGAIWLAGINADIQPPESILMARLRGEMFGGKLEDDTPLVVNGEPLGTVKSDLRGFKFEGDVGLAARIDRWSVGPFAGVGFRWWEFDDVTWRSTYGRLGLRAK